jgi:hypothetical protein
LALDDLTATPGAGGVVPAPVEAIIGPRRPGGDTQKQADLAAGALAKADPARL